MLKKENTDRIILINNIKFCLPVVDTVVFKLNNRFQGLKKVIVYFDFFFSNPSSLVGTDEHIIKAS